MQASTLVPVFCCPMQLAQAKTLALGFERMIENIGKAKAGTLALGFGIDLEGDKICEVT